MVLIKNPTIVGGGVSAYAIVVFLTDATYVGATYIQADVNDTYNTRTCTAKIVITPDAGYRFKDGLLQGEGPACTVFNASSYTFNQSTGELIISEANGRVEVHCECVPE